MKSTTSSDLSSAATILALARRGVHVPAKELRAAATLLGSKGGTSRASTLSKARRLEIAKLASTAAAKALSKQARIDRARLAAIARHSKAADLSPSPAKARRRNPYGSR